MTASTLTFLVKLSKASDRHLNLLYIEIWSNRTSVATNISIFLTIADNQIDWQNNESEVDGNAVGYPVQNTAQISKLVFRYNKLSVYMRVDTKILVRDILADFICLIIFYVNRIKKGV